MRNAAFFGLFFIAISAVTANSQTKPDNMKAFPPTAAGMVRYVWNPPMLENENEARVEIIVGKEAEVDAVNRHFLAGSIREEAIKGWGYNRYIVNSRGNIAGTLMAIPEGQPKVKKFVTLGGEPKLFRYNSKLPVVVYAPKGLIIKFRVWRPDDETIQGSVGN
jgi:ecotin